MHEQQEETLVDRGGPLASRRATNSGHPVPMAFVDEPGGVCPPGGRLHKSLFKIIDIGEIFAAVILGLAEDPVLDQIEYNLAKIRAPVHTQDSRTVLASGPN